MARKTAFAKLTGDLADDREDVLDWLGKLTEDYFLVICPGGGTRITDAFKQRGWDFKFGPLGREIETFEGRQLARNELEINQREMQDRLALRKIQATVIIPVLDIGSVLCHVNGDLFVKMSYLGYNDLFVATLHDRAEKKRMEFGDLPKVQVVSFPRLESTSLNAL